jgi:DNA-binding transcriptional MerR regulator
MHEVAQYQNFFTFPLDTYYNIFDAIYYFSDEKNRNRYTYDQQQLIISRIVRAAVDFGIPIEGVREKLMI